jgi:hypothetical protein
VRSVFQSRPPYIRFLGPLSVQLIVIDDVGDSLIPVNGLPEMEGRVQFVAVGVLTHPKEDNHRGCMKPPLRHRADS